MNKIQRAIGTVGLVLILLMGLFPPWRVSVGSRTESYGFNLIVIAPRRSAVIDTNQLAVQWITVLITTLGFIKLYGKKPD